VYYPYLCGCFYLWALLPVYYFSSACYHMTWFGKTLWSVAALGFAVLFLALSEPLMTFAPSKLMLELRAGLLIFAAPSKLMLELRAGLLIFAAPSKLARGAVAPSGLLPDVVWCLISSRDLFSSDFRVNNERTSFPGNRSWRFLRL
jgi:hypothetical protein